MTQHDPSKPWDIVRLDAVHVAYSATQRLVLRDVRSGRIFLRRGLRGIGLGGAAASRVLPQLNALAGELLQRQDMPGDELGERLRGLAALAHVPPPEPVEMAVAELDGVRVYVVGPEIVVTREDLLP
jgi:hypothetical protein